MEDETSKFHSKGMSVMLLLGGYLNVSANCLTSPVGKNVLLMSALIMPLGFEVLSVSMMSIVFRNVAPCSLLKDNRYFGRKYCHRIQGRRKAEQDASMKAALLSTCFHGGCILLGLFFDPEDGGDMLL
jgi:hypothetical protein